MSEAAPPSPHPPAPRPGSPGGSAEFALVTGASRGLGADMARELARRGIPLVLTARSRPEMEALARELVEAHGVTVHVVPGDLGRPGGADELARRVEALGVPISFLVNNAGFGQWGPYPDLDPDEERAMIRLNMEALTVLTRYVLPGMLRRGHGRVMNVASTAAFLPGPLMTVYYATKAYVLSYSEALDRELRGTGVTVTCLCPGPTETAFQERARMRRSGLLRLGLMESAPVARAGIRGMLRGRRLVVPGIMNRLTTLLPRFLPRRWVPMLVESIQAARGDGEG